MSKLTRERIDEMLKIAGPPIEPTRADVLEAYRLARIGLCFDGVSADDLDDYIGLTTANLDAADPGDERVNAAICALSELLRESEKGGVT